MYNKKGLHTQTRIAQKLQDEGGSLLKKNCFLLPLFFSIFPELTISSLGTISHEAFQLSQMPIVLPKRLFNS